MNPFSPIVEKLNRLSKRTRGFVLASVIGIGGGLAAVGFQLAINFIYRATWPRLAECGTVSFIVWSFVVVVVTGAIAGWLLTAFCPDAAGSGIPQVKLAFWRDFGDVPLRAGFVKFVAGAITIGGGASLGREGPSVHIAGSLASNLAGWLGIAKQARRPALAAGAAAGLAAAFNTPISAITFVLEEVVEDLNSARYLGQTLIAAVLATFVTHSILGAQPAFVIPLVDSLDWHIYLATPFVAAAAAAVGAAFQIFTLDWRDWIRKQNRLPAWARPVVGGLITWALGCGVFLLTRKLGVFSLGYDDLTDILHNQVVWKVVFLMLAAKFVATVASYAWGGCGGIFSPTLFLGAAVGLVLGEGFSFIIPLDNGDIMALSVVGMSACLGAVVRAPITSILIVFEMTHEFTFVPALLLGTLASQWVGRRLTRDNFYTDALTRDGHDLVKLIPPRTLEEYRQSRLGSVANFRPVCTTVLESSELKKLLAQHPYQRIPAVIDGHLQGAISRTDVETAIQQSRKPRLFTVATASPDETIEDAQLKLIQSESGMLVVVQEKTGAVLGVLTLHDLLRIEEQFARAAESA